MNKLAITCFILAVLIACFEFYETKVILIQGALIISLIICSAYFSREGEIANE